MYTGHLHQCRCHGNVFVSKMVELNILSTREPHTDR